MDMRVLSIGLAVATLTLAGAVVAGEIGGGAAIAIGHWAGSAASVVAVVAAAITASIRGRGRPDGSEWSTTPDYRAGYRWVVTGLLALVIYAGCALAARYGLEQVMPPTAGGAQGLLNGLERLGHVGGRVPTLAWGPVLGGLWSLPLARVMVPPRTT